MNANAAAAPQAEIDKMADFREQFIAERHAQCRATLRGAYRRFEVLFEAAHPAVVRA
jgi:hypothetical protein